MLYFKRLQIKVFQLFRILKIILKLIGIYRDCKFQISQLQILKIKQNHYYNE